MKIGIIGTGIMASYIVTGFCDWECEHEFVLSPRNRERSAYLSQKYANVSVAEDNQAVLDQCEYVILSVLPQKAEEILSPLKFRKDHKIISVIAAIGLPKLIELIGETELLVDLLPLPFISKRIGPIVLYPSCPEIEALLRPLGSLIVVDSPEEMNALRSMTALMSPFYELIYSVVEWGEANHLSEPAAKAYAASFFGALTILAGETEEGKLKELAEEMTPGGLNWQATNYLMEQDAFRKWQAALDAIMKRVSGK